MLRTCGADDSEATPEILIGTRSTPVAPRGLQGYIFTGAQGITWSLALSMREDMPLNSCTVSTSPGL